MTAVRRASLFLRVPTCPSSVISTLTLPGGSLAFRGVTAGRPSGCFPVLYVRLRCPAPSTVLWRPQGNYRNGEPLLRVLTPGEWRGSLDGKSKVLPKNILSMRWKPSAVLPYLV